MATLSLTGLPLLAVLVVATVLAPLLVAWRWRRGRHSAHLGLTVLRLLGVLGCQALAVALTFVVVNDNFVFYSNWDDLAGRASGPPILRTQNLVSPGEGRVEVVNVVGRASGAHLPILMWLPPQYDQPAFAHTTFPVVMMLPGQPSSPAVTFSHFHFGRQATTAIDDHLVRPFVAVFPPLMVDPPRDTECTNVPGGPNAEAWLDADVRDATLAHARVSGQPKQWAVMGYSTGAFCAVKLLLRHPDHYAAAAGFGGYYQPITDHTTGNLFRGSKIRYDDNSPLWLYGRTGLASGHRILLITGKQDQDSYAETEKMLAATRGDPGVSSLTYPVGGHNYRNYRNAVPDVLRWLGSGGFGAP